MPGHSRSKNGVASLVYAGHPRLQRCRLKTWMAGTSPAMTAIGVLAHFQVSAMGKSGQQDRVKSR
jgi:hypothetical protein